LIYQEYKHISKYSIFQVSMKKNVALSN
jgi:hypothetical protein